MNDRGPTWSEQFRHECECRAWLAMGYTNRAMVRQLKMRISARRGPAAAERLIAGMREEYAKQREQGNAR